MPDTRVPGRGHPCHRPAFGSGTCGRAKYWSSSSFVVHNIRSGGRPCHQVLALDAAILHKQICRSLQCLCYRKDPGCRHFCSCCTSVWRSQMSVKAIFLLRVHHRESPGTVVAAMRPIVTTLKHYPPVNTTFDPP
jgi:hypothetical protein